MGRPRERSQTTLHSSLFFTGFFALVFQPFRAHAWIHWVIPFWTYWESVCTVMGGPSDEGWVESLCSASRTAVSSILLFVVFASNPETSSTCCPTCTTNAHPPGPGLPRQPPSVQISIGSFTGAPLRG